MYNLSRDTLEGMGRRGSHRAIRKEFTTTARVLDLFKVLVDNEDKSVGPWLVSDGFWESWITSWFTKNIRPGMTVLDVGANSGYYSLLASALVGIDGHVAAYEPNPAYVKMLEKTRLLNPEYYFDIRSVALSSTVGTAILSVPAHLHGSASVRTDFENGEHEGKNVVVPTTTLDNEFENDMFDRWDVIKIDAEGSEEEIFNGAQGILNASSGSTLLIEWTPGAYGEEFYDRLNDWGHISTVSFDGDEVPVGAVEINGLVDWLMLVIRKR